VLFFGVFIVAPLPSLEIYLPTPLTGANGLGGRECCSGFGQFVTGKSSMNSSTEPTSLIVVVQFPLPILPPRGGPKWQGKYPARSDHLEATNRCLTEI